jgi:hypothetical protein
MLIVIYNSGKIEDTRSYYVPIVKARERVDLQRMMKEESPDGGA